MLDHKQIIKLLKMIKNILHGTFLLLVHYMYCSLKIFDIIDIILNFLIIIVFLKKYNTNTIHV